MSPCSWVCPEKSPRYHIESVRKFVSSIDTRKEDQQLCIKCMVDEFEAGKHKWLSDIESIPTHMFNIAQRHFFVGSKTKAPLADFVRDTCGLTFSVRWSVMPKEENFSTGKTVWNMSRQQISMYINRQLIPYCYIDQDHLASDFYKSGSVGTKPASCKFQVGGIGCRKVGCVFEIIVHEMCHVLEYCYRSLLKRCDWDKKYSANDDENEIFCEILYPLTYHKNPYNNLLARNEPELNNPWKDMVYNI
jgi:hypothetical protein